jgi:hypothetical protein
MSNLDTIEITEANVTINGTEYKNLGEVPAMSSGIYSGRKVYALQGKHGTTCAMLVFDAKRGCQSVRLINQNTATAKEFLVKAIWEINQ